MYIADRLGCSADLFVAISENDANTFKRWVPYHKLLVIPQGFNDNVFNPFYDCPQTDRPVVLFFGCLTHVPNKQAVHVIVKDIAPQVASRFPNVVFQIVGSNPPSGLSHPNVEFTGYVENLSAYIRHSTVVIAPILIGGGMRTKIIEALACGKAVISTSKGAEGIRGTYNGLIITDLLHFAEALCTFLGQPTVNDPSDFSELRATFSWNTILPKLHHKIQDIIRNANN
jgi:glycosyltransferase involved in cell wall biosynthesis